MAHPSLHPPALTAQPGNVSLGRACARTLRLFGGLLLPVLAPLPTFGEDDALRTVEQAAEKWVDLRTATTRLETDWATQKPLLESFTRALADRIQALETKRDFLAAKTARDTEELAALESANRGALADIQAAETRVQAVTTQLLQLRAALPPRLSAALEMSYRSLAKPGAPVGERMQLATTVLARCLQFNRDISFGQEPLVLPGESGERVVEVIYWGLGQGYALDRNAGKAWVGRPENGAWAWTPRPEAVEAVAALIAIQQDKADPRFVPLPAQVNPAAK